MGVLVNQSRAAITIFDEQKKKVSKNIGENVWVGSRFSPILPQLVFLAIAANPSSNLNTFLSGILQLLYRSLLSIASAVLYIYFLCARSTILLKASQKLCKASRRSCRKKKKKTIPANNYRLITKYKNSRLV